MAAGRFKNKYDAMNRRQIVWVCKRCETHHDKTLMNLTGKPIRCVECKTRQDFYYFPSRAEAKRFAELRLQECSGMITQLQTQVVYPIVINSVRVTKYIADFVYMRNGRRVVEDVKGNIKFVTDVFKLKQKLIGAIYGVQINLIER